MKTGSSKFIVIGAGVLVLILILAVFYIFFKRGKEAQVPVTPKDERTVKTVEVNAANGKFDPQTIQTELFADIDLVVNAKDGDYEFKVEGYPRLDTTIKKGESKKIELYSLGVGEYSYTCGDGCGGKIIVSQQIDEEEED